MFKAQQLIFDLDVVFETTHSTKCNSFFPILKNSKSKMQARAQLDGLFVLHAVLSVLYGLCLFILPHSIALSWYGGEYNHLLHEVLRLYGTLTFVQGWLVWQTRKVNDAFIRRTFTQAYCLCFGLQTLVLLRAQMAVPAMHSITHSIQIFVCFVLFLSYGYVLLFTSIKAFELPGNRNLL